MEPEIVDRDLLDQSQASTPNIRCSVAIHQITGQRRVVRAEKPSIVLIKKVHDGNALEIGLAVLPRAVIFYLMVICFWPATWAMPIAWFVAAIVNMVG